VLTRRQQVALRGSSPRLSMRDILGTVRGVLVAFAVTLSLVGAALAERLPIKAYTSADGLAHERVTCVVSDSRGFVWFCTADGLSRFDGHSFSTHAVPRVLPDAGINDFLETSAGEYWVATNGGGVQRINRSVHHNLADDRVPQRSWPAGTADGPRFVGFSVGEDPETSRVNVLYEDRDGRLWAGTDGGLFFLDDSVDPAVFRPVQLNVPSRPDRAVQIWVIVGDREGGLWIGTSWGLVRRLSDGRMIHSAVQPTQGADHVRALLIDREERVWIGHHTGLFILRPEDVGPSVSGPVLRSREMQATGKVTLPTVAGTAVRYTTQDGLSGGMVRALLQSSDGQIWIATMDGLTQFDGERFRAFTKAHGVPGATSLAEDRHRNVWIGTGGAGALRLARNGFTSYTEADGLSATPIRSVLQGPAGDLHVVSVNQHIHRFDGTRFAAVRVNLSEDVGAVNSGVALQDRAGEWWIPGGAGLYRFPKVENVEQLGRIRPKAIYTTRDGLAGDDVNRLFEDSRGDIWIGRTTPTSLALTRWERATGTFHRYSDADGVPGFSRTTAFGEDREGNVWIGFWEAGLARYRNGRFTLFTTANGAPAGAISSLHVDQAGRLWVSSARGGVSRIDSPGAARPDFVSYTTANGLASNRVTIITEDRWGRMYLGMPAGLDRLDPAGGHVRHFTTADGLTGGELLSGFRDRDGTLWFGGYNGLSRLVPTPDRPKSPPEVFIGGLRVAGETYLTFDLGERNIPQFELEPNQNQLQIEFFGLATGAGDELRYQYWLEGADKHWNEPIEQRNVNYANLSPGRYRFVVRAVADDGALSQNSATVAFTILQPVWQRWWFLTMATLVIATGVFWLYRTRVASLLALERVRTRIATDLHDDLGSNLSQIAIISEVLLRGGGKQDRAMAKLLSLITTTANESVEAMSDIVWAIDPKGDSLQNLIRRMRRFASDGFTAKNIEFEFLAPELTRHVEMGADLRREVFLCFKEAVNNVLRHSKCTRAEIEVRLDGGDLLLRVSDNGKGFDTTNDADGQGLVSMRQRARNLTGTLEITCAPGNGTTIALRAPLGRRAGRTALPT
jgi:ligand-binding sensor domain-containing protein/signal transduction histidine kinase